METITAEHKEYFTERPFTDEDVNTVRQMLTDGRKSFVLLSVGMFMIAWLLPFIPDGRRYQNVLFFSESPYIDDGLCFSVLVVLMLIFVYWRSWYPLSKDLRKGIKIVMHSRIKKALTYRDEKWVYPLQAEYKEKFFIVKEKHNWNAFEKGNFIRAEILPESKIAIRYTQVFEKL